MRTLLLIAALAALFQLAGCNEAADTADTTERGGANAVGVAEQMSGGTVGDTDMDSGESSDGGE
ncbi:hypothetical protein IT575_08570 [bacterium]|nr:hypothetical protein [bacterium]